jgi:peptidyl-prolyl cis-trans isomerase C
MAVIVNGDGIMVAEYQAELFRYQEAIGRELTPEDEQLVLGSMIDEVILAQAAAESGYIVTDQDLDQRIGELGAKAGGEGLANWLQRYGYDEAGFRRALTRAMVAAWMRDEITSEVPTSMEQVHVRQIFLTDRQEADQIFNRLQAGADFEAVAYEYDPVTRGELGWFPRGYLFEPLVESVAFELEAGQFSQVIESGLGFHILYMIERETDRPLLQDALQRLQAQYLSAWLQTARQESNIQILVQ